MINNNNLLLPRVEKTTTTPTRIVETKLFESSSAVNNEKDDNDNNDELKMLSIEEASTLLSEFDKNYNPDSLIMDDNKIASAKICQSLLPSIPSAVMSLAKIAAQQREVDSTQGRCMLGICASSASEGLTTLKAWVTALQLPRGLLHGMDKDGVPVELDGGVYIKYNSGGVYSFADIRKSGLGFDALWKPGDALLEPYDGTFRGVYFQVELTDGEFRQYLVPLDTFILEVV